MIEDQIKTEAVDIPETPTAQQPEQAVPQTAEIADPYAVTDEMRAEATKGADAKIKAWREFSEALPAMETKEQREKRERREKSRKIISAVSDGLSALGNLYFTTQYAPNMYNHEKSSASKAEQARIDKAKAEREANRDAHLKYSLAIADAEAEKARTIRELEAAQEKRREAAERAKREAELQPLLVAIKEAQGRKEKGLADKAESDAAVAKAVADYAEEMQRKKGATEDAKAASYRGRAAASYASANASASKGGSQKSDSFNVENGDGEVRTINDKDLDREFSALPEDERRKAGNPVTYGQNKPTKEQKKQAVAEHERTKQTKKKTGINWK